MDERSRQYLRSRRFRVFSWLSGGLVVASFFVPNHRVWVLYAAVAVSLAAMLPVLRVVPYNRTIDVHNRSDRRSLLAVAVFVAIILAGAFAVAFFGSH